MTDRNTPRRVRACGNSATALCGNNTKPPTTPMDRNIYAIHDTRANDVNSLMLFPNHASAIRAFSEMLRESAFMRNNAEDFSLVELGALVKDHEGDPYIAGHHAHNIIITAKQIIDSQEAVK